MAPNKVHLHFDPIARLIHMSELKGQRQYCPTKSMCASLNIRNCLKAQFRSQSPWHLVKMHAFVSAIQHKVAVSEGWLLWCCSTRELWFQQYCWAMEMRQGMETMDVSFIKYVVKAVARYAVLFSPLQHTHTLRLNIQIEPKKHALIYTITPTHKHLLRQVCCTKGWLYNTTHFNHQSG